MKYYFQHITSTAPPRQSAKPLIIAGLVLAVLAVLMMYLLHDEHQFRTACMAQGKGRSASICHQDYLQARKGTWAGSVWVLMAHGGTMPRARDRRLWP